MIDIDRFLSFLILAVLFLSIIFFVRIIYRAFFFLWLFQLKDYRFDRLLVHFRETKEGRRIFLSVKELILWFLFFAPFLYQFSYLRQPYVVGAHLILMAMVFIYEAKTLLVAVKSRQFRKPIFTGKASVLTFLTMFTIILWGLPSLSPIILIFIDRFLIVIIAFFVLLLNILTFLVRTVLVMLAKRKILQMKKLLVIAVTGSYGKSSTKDLIADFLSLKYKVLKTPGSVNTDLGIALFILKNLTRQYQVFVVEIGVYKRGEMEYACSFIKPKVGVLTGINEQHLSLFGSLENTKRAKVELIEALPVGNPSSFALFNGDDPITFDLSKHQKIKSYTYSVKQLPTEIRVKKNPFLSNVAAAYLLAQKLGVNQELLQKKLIKSLSSAGLKAMKKGNVTVLNDSFNTNPKGFASALDVLSTYKGKKILITPGIIELGGESQRIHKELGRKIGTICDVVILANDNFEEPIRHGLMETNFEMRNFFVPKREDLVAAVKKYLEEKTVILLEGRMPVEITLWLSS